MSEQFDYSLTSRPKLTTNKYRTKFCKRCGLEHMTMSSRIDRYFREFVLCPISKKVIYIKNDVTKTILHKQG